ncbi:hypothetical protein V8E53_009252 [Lactarius tabidus]
MAGPLRRVSQNYQWTLKRAHNDLHNSITPELQPAPAPSNIDINVSPWDSARLQWKFKSEYDELREHLEHSFLIILGWWVTFKHLTKAITEHFFTQPEQAISNLFKQSTKLSSQVIFSFYLSLWDLLTALFRYVVLRVAFPTQPFLSRSTNWFGANKRGETGTNPAGPPSSRQSLHDEQSILSTSSERTLHTPPDFEGSPTITVMSEPAYSALDGHLMGVLKDGMEMLQSAMHVGEGKPFYGSPSLGDVNRIPHANEIAGFVDLH